MPRVAELTLPVEELSFRVLRMPHEQATAPAAAGSRARLPGGASVRRWPAR